MRLLEGLRLVGFEDNGTCRVDQVVHFLLSRLDAQACRAVCKDCWPIIEMQRDGRRFRAATTKVFLGWKKEKKLRSVVRQGILDEPWGTGRLLGGLLNELLLMVMKKECGEAVAGERDVRLLMDDCEMLRNQIRDVGARTDAFLKAHPVGHVDAIRDDHDVVDRLNDAMSLDPMVAPDCTTAAVLSNRSLEAFLAECRDSLRGVPRVPNPHSLHNQSRALEGILEDKHRLLVSLHSKLDRQARLRCPSEWSIENESMDPRLRCPSEWSIENESMNLIP